MSEKNSKISSIGQIFLILGLAIFILVLSLIKKNLDSPILDIMLNILSIALLLSLILSLQPFSQKFDKDPVDGIKFILVFLISLIFVSLIFSNLVDLQEKRGFSISFSEIVTINFYNFFVALTVSLVFSIFLRIFFHERSKEAKVNLSATFVYFFLSELLKSYFEFHGLLSQAVTIFQLALFMWASFRIPWIIKLSKKDKYKTLILSLFVIVCLVLLQSQLITGNIIEGVKYQSILFFLFLYSYLQPFLTIYFLFVFGSTLFHLPTGEIYERKITELSMLQKIGKLAAQLLDVREFIETAVKSAMEITNSQSAWLEINLPRTGKIYEKSGIEESEILKIKEKIECKLNKFSSQNPNLTFCVENFDGKTIIVTPLVARGIISGFMYLIKEKARFNQDEINLAIAFADQIAIGVENSTLIQESIDKERLLREFELARQMQKKLLPKSLPKSEKFEISALSIPALEVGGDYYDFFIHKNGNLSLIVADVSGKGVSAAFYMAELKGIFQSLAKLYPFPNDFIAKANETIFEHIDKKFFITIAYAYFDMKKNTVHVARAGHLPPVFVRNQSVKLLKIPGIGIGLITGYRFQKSLKHLKLKLRKNDLLIFFSDGVVEAMSENNEEFGYKRLKETIVSEKEKPVDEIVKAIYDKIIKHQGKAKQFDDITIVAIKWKK